VKEYGFVHLSAGDLLREEVREGRERGRKREKGGRKREREGKERGEEGEGGRDGVRIRQGHTERA